MKKVMSILALFIVLSSCKEELVKKPQRLIERGVMVDIMYDLSLLEAIKYQNPSSVQNYKANPAEFVFEKYKIDSTQFAQNNRYYASDYTEYKVMYDEVMKRIDDEKKLADSLVKLEKKKKAKAKKAKVKKPKLATDSLTKKDSLIGTAKRQRFINKNLIKEPILKKEALQ